MKNKNFFILCLSLIVLLTFGCKTQDELSPPEAKIKPDGLVHIKKLVVIISKTLPTQAKISVNGYLPTPGYQVLTDQTIIKMEGNKIIFNIFQKDTTPPGFTNIQVLVPYEDEFIMDISDLKAGTYVVEVNNLSTSFTL